MEYEELRSLGARTLLLACAMGLPGCRQTVLESRAGESTVTEARGSTPAAPQVSAPESRNEASGGSATRGVAVDGTAASGAGGTPSDVDPGTLAQTDEKPQVNTEHFRQLSQALFDAIKSDEVELALPYFFPKAAYAQVKAIKNPDQDWERRLVAAFRRDVHGYHVGLGPGARLLGLQVSAANTRFMKRGAEGNRLGYFRTTRASLTYADAGGRERTLLVSSLISWRGQWYVVHLNGFH